MKKEYIKDTDHTFPFDKFGKTWVGYVPGYEGLYAISTDGWVCSLERSYQRIGGGFRVFESRLLRLNGGMGGLGVTITTQGITKRFTQKALLSYLEPRDEVREFPFGFEDSVCVAWVPEFEGLFAITDTARVVRIETQSSRMSRRYVQQHIRQGLPTYMLNRPGLVRAWSVNRVKRWLAVRAAQM